jgi:hypothetical protein
MGQEIRRENMMHLLRRHSVLIAAVLFYSFAGCAALKTIEHRLPAIDGARPWTDHAFKNDPKDFHFAIITDRTGGHRPGVFRKALLKINLLQPEFVICVGDLIEGYTDDRCMLKQQYDQMDAMLEILEMRFFRVVGNHDITNAVMDEVYRARYGFPYYHFVYKNALFLILSTEDQPGIHISDAQVHYFHDVLKENTKVRWTFVFMHRPLFVKLGGKLHTGWSEIESILQDRPHTVFAGHWHTYAKQKKHGQSYIRLATTGGASKLRGISAGEFDHIVWVTLTDNGPRIANLMLDGIHDENIGGWK